MPTQADYKFHWSSPTMTETLCLVLNLSFETDTVWATNIPPADLAAPTPTGRTGT
jgi:hypothetical protein